MILTCEKCQTKYMVKPEAINSNGRSVKCVKCGHIWKQFPEGSTPPGKVEPTPETLRAVPRGGALPVIQDNPVSLGLKLLPVCLLLLTGLVTFALYQDIILRKLPVLAPIYEIAGLHNTKNVALKDLAISQKLEDDGNKQFILKGKLANFSTEKRVLPNLKISLKDKKKKVIQSFTLKSTGEVLTPGEVLDFTNTLPNIPETAHFITVDIGNKVELLVR